MATDRKICIAQITGAHGVRGQVRVRAFTEKPRSVAAYGPLCDAEGVRTFTLAVKGSAPGGQIIATLSGVDNRNAAEALKGVRLFASRARLPKPGKREYYHADLIGMAAVTAGGRKIGKVSALHDFGAGPVLEIERAGSASIMLPFTDAVVPEVDVAAARMVVDVPKGWLDGAEKPARKQAGKSSGKRATQPQEDRP
ncbi:MAG: 16S rRNA processing protein RimM [Alphaproteobacteria bacterium]|nr:16S rRNA processing protein RimM [Alphaproteobacteria bacterium]